VHSHSGSRGRYIVHYAQQDCLLLGAFSSPWFVAVWLGVVSLTKKPAHNLHGPQETIRFIFVYRSVASLGSDGHWIRSAILYGAFYKTVKTTIIAITIVAGATFFWLETVYHMGNETH
jgi:hypothetical protein